VHLIRDPPQKGAKWGVLMGSMQRDSKAVYDNKKRNE